MSSDPHEHSRSKEPDSSGGSGSPIAVPVSARMIAPVARQSGASPPHQRGIDKRALWHAFCRRWFVAISAGLIAAIAAAAAAWYWIPPSPYRVYAEFRVKSYEPRVLFKTAEQETKFDTYKKTQMRLVTGPFVIAAALRDPKIANLPLFDELQERGVLRSRPVDPAEWLEENLIVSSPDTEFIQVALEGDRAEDLVAVINAVTNAYLEEVVNADRKRRQQRLEDLRRVHQELEEELRTKRAAMRRLSEQLETSSPQAVTAKEEIAYQVYGDLKREYSKIHFEWLQAKVQLQAKEANSTAGLDISIPDAVVDAHLMQDPKVVQAQAEIDRLEKIVKRYESVAPENPRLVEAREDLVEAQNSLELTRKQQRPIVLEQLRSRLSLEAQASEAELREKIAFWEIEKRALEEELSHHKAQQKENAVLAFELEALHKEIRQREEVSDSLAEEISRLDVEVAEAEPRVTLYRPAEAPRFRDTSNKVKLGVLASLGTFALVVAGIVWLELTSRRVSSVDDVVEALQLKVMGALPLLPRWSTEGVIGRLGRSRIDRWNNAMRESVDSARTFLLQQANGRSLQVLMVASALGSEGKTTVTCHLGNSMARAGRRTVLIDCDIRQPAVHEIFSLPLTPGLCEVLRGECDLDDVVRRVEPDGLWVVPAGEIDQAALHSLAKDGLQPIFQRLREEFDFVLADSSPILPVTDGLLVAQCSDGAVITIRRGVSRMPKVAAACQRLKMLGVPVLGTVMIGLDESYYGRYYTYGYHPGVQVAAIV